MLIVCVAETSICVFVEGFMYDFFVPELCVRYILQTLQMLCYRHKVATPVINTRKWEVNVQRPAASNRVAICERVVDSSALVDQNTTT